MRAIFIADAHLNNPIDPNYCHLMKFVQEMRGTIGLLCILGDLFDFRVGLPHLKFIQHTPMIEALMSLTESGTRVIYLEGNHDFRLGTQFERKTGIEVYSGPLDLVINGRNVHLCHGHMIDPGDICSHLLHKALRIWPTYQAARMLPARVIEKIRDKLQHCSRRSYSNPENDRRHTSVVRSFARTICHKNFDALIVGHYHLPFSEKYDSFDLISLGDWITQFSYAVMDDNGFSLDSYPIGLDSTATCVRFSTGEPDTVCTIPVTQQTLNTNQLCQ